MEVTSRHMKNSIFEKQNEEFLLKCLMVQRKDYSSAKRINSYKSLATFLFSLLTIIASAVNVEVLSAICGLFAICLLIAYQYFDAYIEEHQARAALIQQYFDVSLYSFELNNESSEWGVLPTKTDLAEILCGVEFPFQELEKVRDWYSNYSSLEPVQQVFYCQKENLRWDFKLRSEFRSLLVCSFITICAILVVLAIVVNPSFVKFVSVVSWLLPIADFCYGYFKKLSNDVERLDRLKEKSDTIEKMISTWDSDECINELICLQDQIYKNRKIGILVPDWFYNLRKTKHQLREDEIATLIQNMPKGSSD